MRKLVKVICIPDPLIRPIDTFFKDAEKCNYEYELITDYGADDSFSILNPITRRTWSARKIHLRYEFIDFGLPEDLFKIGE